MNIFTAKSTAAWLLLSLLATPAMANSFFSDIATFGQELWDETKKLAPGIQYDKRNEAAPVVQASPNDGRDLPALEPENANIAVSQVGKPSNTSVAEAPARQLAPVAANHGWQFEEQDHLK
ncbi:hypothetical protein [Oceanisphaera pacifica]|uniref:Uncharacterized protein n=1 Tax=Oceanisphaera pacifica TaxID=2818389 RepID=A0ABS3ND01_9GAMM|nr:hypothetical protein [Oceanisphaera pacifica]MBO1518467.1 hypothetical protein [Oceanisphaera pacifica]